MRGKRGAWLRYFIIFITVAVLSLGPAACTTQPGVKVNLESTSSVYVAVEELPAEEGLFYFGFDRCLEPKEEVKMYVSFLRYLEKATGYRFRLRITPRNSSIVDELGTGKVDFAALGSLSYLQAHEKYGVAWVAKGLNHKGHASYRALIVTRPGSPIRSLKDLRGRTFAFGAVNSTQGHLIPRIMLAEAGLELRDLRGFGYLGSHADVANAVISGQYDAGGIQDTLGTSLADRGLVKVVAISREFPGSGIAVRPGVAPEVLESVKRALLEFDPTGQHRQNLYAWDQTEMPRGFQEEQGEDYHVIAQWARRIGLLD